MCECGATALNETKLAEVDHYLPGNCQQHITDVHYGDFHSPSDCCCDVPSSECGSATIINA